MQKIISMIAMVILISACASDDANKELSLNEKKAELYYSQGTSDLIKKSYQQALVNLIKAKELNPDDSKIRTNLGMAYYFREQTQLALQELKEAIKLDAKNNDAKLNLATIYMEKNNLKEAKELYQKVASSLTYEAMYRVYYNMAILDLKIGDRQSAFDNLNKSLKEKEDYCSAHFKLGELYTEEYKYKEAYESFTEATKGLCTSEPAPHYYQAQALINLNRKQEAKTKLNHIIEKFPKSNFKILAQKKLRAIIENNETETADLKTDINNNEHQTTTETPKF